jgi:hypothetical protein
MTNPPSIPAVIYRAAERELRTRIRQAIVDAATVDRMSAHQIEVIEDEVLKALADKRIAWAIAYMAGVTMAPDILKLAQPRPAQPLGERGAVSGRS